METTIDPFEIGRAAAVIGLGASGTWLLLPHRHGQIKPRHSYYVGAALVGAAGLLLATLWKAPSGFLTAAFFYVFGLTALAGGILTVVSRNPVYSALWFASVVLSTSGLFLLSGAQFLAAGTIIVYAGAIIVTFLFVIMLAQREGRATYDRMARSPGRATFTCALLFWTLLYALIVSKTPIGYRPDNDNGDFRLTRGSSFLQQRRISVNRPVTEVVRRSLTETNRLPESGGASASGRHVAGLGGTLFTDHLVTVELAGALLFVALIGALAIAAPKAPVRPSIPNPPPPG